MTVLRGEEKPTAADDREFGWWWTRAFTQTVPPSTNEVLSGYVPVQRSLKYGARATGRARHNGSGMLGVVGTGDSMDEEQRLQRDSASNADDRERPKMRCCR